MATFSSVRSGNRTARAAERSLLVGLRPVLMPSRLEDPPEKIPFLDGHWLKLDGGHAGLEVADEAVYLGIALRNAGNGIAVLDGWAFFDHRVLGDAPHADLDDFRRLTRDIYIAAGSLGFWQGSIRDATDPAFDGARQAAAGRRPVTVELLYGDHEGGQRTISRFTLMPRDDERRLPAFVATGTSIGPTPAEGFETPAAPSRASPR
ncbi:MAG: hypothetical protein ACR2KV_10535 [Solirubrobacteraceae bacterium]